MHPFARHVDETSDELDLTPTSHLDGGGECVIHECIAEVFASSKSISMEIFRSALAADNINNPIPLHYFMLYHYSSPMQIVYHVMCPLNA